MPVTQAKKADSSNSKLSNYADEVLKILGADLSRYNDAFAQIAHRHNIYHSREREQYSYFYRAVLRCVKKKIKTIPKKQLSLF